MIGLEALGIVLALLTTGCMAYLMVVAIYQGQSQLLIPNVLVLVFSVGLLVTIIAMIKQRNG